jgi:hypothetical protein
MLHGFGSGGDRTLLQSGEALFKTAELFGCHGGGGTLLTAQLVELLAEPLDDAAQSIHLLLKTADLLA